jgi:hypothetical protein
VSRSTANGVSLAPQPVTEAEKAFDDALEDWAEGDAAKDRKILDLEQSLADLRYLASTVLGFSILDASQGVTRH